MPKLLLLLAALHPLVQPLAEDEFAAAHRHVRQARHARYLSVEYVGYVRLRASKNSCDLAQREDIAFPCLFLHRFTPRLNLLPRFYGPVWGIEDDVPVHANMELVSGGDLDRRLNVRFRRVASAPSWATWLPTALAATCPGPGYVSTLWLRFCETAKPAENKLVRAAKPIRRL